MSALSALLALGCAEAKAPPASDAPTPAADGSSEVAGGEFGVPECDRFASKYRACLDKVPETTRALARQAFDQTIEHWRLTASKPDRREGLAAACAQQEKATRAAMSRYDCEW